MRKYKKLTLIAATRNLHKIQEITKMLRGTGICLKTLDDFPPVPEVKENGRTLAANAIKKAETVSRAFGLPALSDDSGLFVPSLGNLPGVRSARYAGPSCDYADNNTKLLRALENATVSKRKAYFATVMALARPGRKTQTRIGKLAGRIIAQPQGKNGFGYDPVFVPAGFKQTLAEMKPAEKNKISHRARALAKIAAYLRNELEKRALKG
ncbi:MAG: RdgB/HAM1 family non-canonical purine NTP pyrophosphatase [Candidatus Firestonebacteria bacterium]|nr:RdgB/HAM1 family non-canonical purine NTP pyrophosphatase [Candidatus Firestonebacteria bacterium]